MLQALSGVWALLVGIVLIMLGNGMHFTLTGLSGGIEWVSAAELAVVRPGYFLGFLSGARFTPVLIKRVGHVRDLAVLGSFMSAGLMAFTLLAEPWAWTLLRALVGFCDPDLQDECGEGPGPARPVSDRCAAEIAARLDHQGAETAHVGHSPLPIFRVAARQSGRWRASARHLTPSSGP
jgi:hypothetical protein